MIHKNVETFNAHIICTWITLFMFFFSSDWVSAQNLLIKSAFQSKLVIDGDPSDWNVSDSILLKDKRGLSDNLVWIKSAWDYQNLYLFFSVIDKDLRALQTQLDHPLLSEDDMIEFLFDTENQKSESWLPDDICYHINILGQKKDDRGHSSGDYRKHMKDWNGKAKYELKIMGTVNNYLDNDIGYNAEVAVPWNEIGMEPRINNLLGLNLACGDNDGKGKVVFNWSNSWPMRKPDSFGTLVLIE
ncbi:MAG: sugar-binding protein [Bacteroidota bacterium]